MQLIDIGEKETIPLSQVANSFGMTEIDMHKIILQYSNKNSVKIMAVGDFGGYCLSREYAEEINAAVKSLSNSILNIADIKNAASNNVPIGDCPRIYFLMSDGEIVYIGMTCALLMRIGNHQKDKKFDSVATFKVKREALSLTESLNIYHFKPLLNRQVFLPWEYFREVLRRCVFE